ncbi:MAG: hypothetical protein J2P18_03420, partial [Nocardia sp.]|nr:hypothetical protein [Nocardia sp.]
SHALVRLAVSYISTPSTAPRDAPEELSRLLTPYVLAMIGEFRPATIPE